MRTMTSRNAHTIALALTPAHAGVAGTGVFEAIAIQLINGITVLGRISEILLVILAILVLISLLGG
jgi:hypothetical protein